MIKIFSNEEMLDERYMRLFAADYECITYSVEYGANNYADDTYNGTLNECIDYVKQHITREDAAEYGLQIAEIGINSEGLFEYCHALITDLEDIYAE